MWTCLNGHDVPDGSFACPRCGTEAIADPDRPLAQPSPPTVHAVRARARTEIGSRLAAGAVLVVFGLIGVVAAALVAGQATPTSDGVGLGVLLLAVVGYVLVSVGSGFVLVAVVAHGVRLGIEAARGDRRD